MAKIFSGAVNMKGPGLDENSIESNCSLISVSTSGFCDDHALIKEPSGAKKCSSDLKSFYWKFLFETLQRVLSEILSTCQLNKENVNQCEEVLSILENYRKDFHNLFSRMVFKNAKENDKQRALTKPTSDKFDKENYVPTSGPVVLENATQTDTTCKGPVTDKSVVIGLDSAVVEQKPAPETVVEHKNEILPLPDKADEVNSSDEKFFQNAIDSNIVKDNSISEPVLPLSLIDSNLPTVSVEKSNEVDIKTSQTFVAETSELKPQMDKTPAPSIRKYSTAASSKPLLKDPLKPQRSQTMFIPSTKQDATKLVQRRSLEVPTRSNPRPPNSMYNRRNNGQPIRNNPSTNFNRNMAIVRNIAAVKYGKTGQFVGRQGDRTASTSSISSCTSSQSYVDRLKGSYQSVNSSSIATTPASAKTSVTDIAEGDGDQSASDDSYGWKVVQRKTNSKNKRRPKTCSVDVELDQRSISIDLSFPCSNSCDDLALVDATGDRRLSNPDSKTEAESNRDPIVLNAFEKSASMPDILQLSTTRKSSRQTAQNSGLSRVEEHAERTPKKEFKHDKNPKSRSSQSNEHLSRNPTKKRSSNNLTKNRSVSKSAASLLTGAVKTDSFDLQVSKAGSTDNVASELSFKALDQPLLITTSSALSWGDLMDQEDPDFKMLMKNNQIRDKLLSPSRKRSPSESIRRHEEKQAKAQEQRERLLEEKARKLREMSMKVEERRQMKEEQTQQKLIQFQQKLQKAEEKRFNKIQAIVRKAHDEEEKVNEIAFINSLDAQNKRHDILTRFEGHEARLESLQEERQRKNEEKVAKETAAEERRRTLEAERQMRLEELKQKRIERELKIEQQQIEKEKERMEVACQKAREREERLSARQAAHQQNVEELQKKIQQKQEESARRHDEKIEHIKLKAFELSVYKSSNGNNDDAPAPALYQTKKLCLLCNVIIGSDVFLLSHLRGLKHKAAVEKTHNGSGPSIEELELYNLKNIIDAPADKIDPQIVLDTERQKALKKRCRKLKMKVASRGDEINKLFTTIGAKSKQWDNEKRSKWIKCHNELKRCMPVNVTGPLPAKSVLAIERTMGEITRMIQKMDEQDCRLMFDLDIFKLMWEVIELGGKNEKQTTIPAKSLSLISNTYKATCVVFPEVGLHFICSNIIGDILDLTVYRFTTFIPATGYLSLDNTGSLPCCISAVSLLNLVSAAFGAATEEIRKYDQEQRNKLHPLILDALSYTISLGVIDRLSQYAHSILDRLSTEGCASSFVLAGIELITTLTNLLHCIYSNTPANKKKTKTEDVTQLSATLRVTELFGSISMLYGLLLHSGAPSRCEGASPPPPIDSHTVDIVQSTLKMLNCCALFDLQMFQEVVGSEGISLQFRHIASYLFWYCSHHNLDNILNDVILLVGYFTSLNSDNQVVIQSGHTPTVLQQLCNLPFKYFSDPKMVSLLFPTLICCCYPNSLNKSVLEGEVSSQMITKYLEEEIETKQNSIANGKQPDKTCYDPCTLGLRFPEEKWTLAIEFFTTASA